MDAAGYFACCEEAGDGVSIGVQYFGACVDAQAAHGVVDARGYLDGIVGSGVERFGEAGSAKVRIRSGCDISVPGCQCIS